MDTAGEYDDTHDYPFEDVAGSGDENKIRGNWSAKADYFISIVGFLFAVGNLWRFPNQVAEHGGVAYLFPYLTLLVLTVLPILILESALGQFASQGSVSAWKICPLFKGIGVSMLVISAIFGVYYNIITSWAVYYALNALKFNIPWASCNNPWNTENCSAWDRETVEACRLSHGQVLANGSCLLPAILTTTMASVIEPLAGILTANGTSSSNALNTTLVSPTDTPITTSLPPSYRVLPSLEYFHNQVLMLSSGILDFQTINWQMAIVLFVVWLFVFLCSFKGVKTSGKAAYLTVTLPYVIIVMLLVRLFLLPGSLDALRHFFRPNWKVLRDPKVWSGAAVQAFYSLSTCSGGVVVLSSYNRFHNNLFRDVWILAAVDFFTSMLLSVLVFSAIGFVSYEVELPLSRFQLQDGIQLTFVFFAEALSRLPVAQLCCFVFFLMVALITFSGELFIVETIVSSICDEFPERLRKNHRHVLTFTLIGLFTAGLVLCATPGAYWIVLFERFLATWPLIIIAFFEVMTLCWIYGVDNFLDNIKWMTGYYPPVYLFWKLLWKFGCPMACLLVLASVWEEQRPLTYNNVTYPEWALVLGWGLALSPIAIILCTAVYKYATASGSLRWRDLLCPEDDWGPALALHRAEMYPLQIPEARRLMAGRPYIKQDRIEPAMALRGEHFAAGGTQIVTGRWVRRPGKYALSVLSDKETVI